MDQLNAQGDVARCSGDFLHLMKKVVATRWNRGNDSKSSVSRINTRISLCKALVLR